MKMTGNTILITGGGSGIGLGLAVEFSKLGNEVIIAGRSTAKLEAAKRQHPALHTRTFDITNAEGIEPFVRRTIEEFPRLNGVIHSAGVMKPELLLQDGYRRAANDETIATNLLGTLRLTEALLPQFRKQPHATVMTVTSGLAFVPLAPYPTYCATKAAVHSYTESLRYLLKDTAIDVIELAPPYVATTLGGDAQAKDPAAMPLPEFIQETMQILKDNPKVHEVLVQRVHMLRYASQRGPAEYGQFFTQFNDMMTANHAKR